jgi:two-component system chemotaxis sensor kinase CheA
MEDFTDDFSLDELNTLLNMFRDQSLQILDEMTQDLFVLETKGADPECLGRLRRGAHTIKGDSACVGLDSITELAHKLEDFMEALVSGGLKFDARSVDSILEGLDEIRAALSNESVADIPADRAQILIQKIEEAAMDAAEAAVSLACEESIEPATEQVAEVEAVLVASHPEKSPRKRKTAARKTPPDNRPRSAKPRRKAKLEEPVVAIETGGLVEENPQQEVLEIAQDFAETPVYADLVEGKKESASEANQETMTLPGYLAQQTVVARKAGSEFVRVEAAKIDALLNLAGEMVIARSVISQLEPELEAVLERNDLFDRFGRARTQMDKLIAQLHKSVVKIRMVTIDNVFKRFNRPMRELALDSGKQVELEMSGGETEMDRALVDLIYEPILHLLRNAVDHGIETAEERGRAGKPEAGQIHMRAYHEGNQVVVEVSDDGRGIDKEALKKKALEKGMVSEEEAARMSDEEALELIFVAGFSTAKEITRVSGRGVGMDAVRNAIEQMRGSVSVRSEVGAGTIFTLRMPLTLAIIRALLFSTSGQLFALPLMSVREIVRISLSEVTNLDGFENYRLREQFISVVKPSLVLGIERRKGGSGAAMRQASEAVYLIIVTAGNKKYAVVADSLYGDQELVIKPLDIRWVHNDALAGASVLGDGRVVLIMDAEMMFRKAIRHERNKGSEKRQYAVS